jgi:hypothetical protein
MQIREGAYYRTRGGAVVGPMQMQMRDDSCYCWESGTDCWTDKGEFEEGRQWEHDLISEVYVSDTPPSLTATTITNGLPHAMPEAKTLRDEFAMEAMKLLLPKHDWAEGMLAFYSYNQADAMMEARKK